MTIPQKKFDVRSVSAVRQSSVTVNTRTYKYPPLKLPVTEEGLTAKIGLTLNFSLEWAYYLPHISP